jgi:hypothetical protein
MALNPNDSDIIAEYADALVYAGQPRRSVERLKRWIGFIQSLNDAGG